MEIYGGKLQISRTGSGQFRHRVTYKDKRGIRKKALIEPGQRAYGNDIADGAEVEIALAGEVVLRCALPGQLGDAAALEQLAATAASQKPVPREKPPVPVRDIMRTGDSRQKKNASQTSGNSNFTPKLGHAPYNFAAYMPGLIVPPVDDEERKWSGRIDCSLEALTPLLVGSRHEKGADDVTICRFLRVDGKPCIPGSTVKGMLRSLVEILSYSGLRPVSNKKLFWRNVASKNSEYHALFKAAEGADPKDDRIMGGFLRRKGAQYTLTPTQVSKDPGAFGASGRRVETGNRIRPRTPSVYYFQVPKTGAVSIDFPDEVAARLWDQLTDDQKKRPHVSDREKLLASAPGLPVFYREERGKIAELGFCRYFRVAYRYSPWELAWPKGTNPDCDDMARSIFGHAGKEGEGEKSALAGRVAVEAFTLAGSEQCERDVVLGGPKPTCLPFYLCQGRIRGMSGGAKNDPDSMNNYNNPESRLRGRKLYWHHIPDPEKFPRNKDNKKVTVELHPLAAGAAGSFSLYVRDLTDSELGCIFEALELQEGCAHRLGMARPLGYGSVKITVRDVFIADSGQKYASLAARLKNAPQVMTKEQRAELRRKFQERIFAHVKASGQAGSAQSYYELEPIRQLYLILNRQLRLPPDDTAYESLTEYGSNLLLPLPKEVVGRDR